MRQEADSNPGPSKCNAHEAAALSITPQIRKERRKGKEIKQEKQTKKEKERRTGKESRKEKEKWKKKKKEGKWKIK